MTRVMGLLLLATTVHADWGKDVNPGAGPLLLDLVREDVLAMIANPRRIEGFAEEKAVRFIEALKRFRNPELKALFVRLLDHEDWRMQHRALFALEYFGDGAVVGKAWELLRHPNRRLREKAAITCVKLILRGAGAPGGAGGVDALLSREEDPHVRSCLVALKAAVRGKLPVERVSREHVRRYRNGLMLTPFLNGMSNAAKVAPGYRAHRKAREGSGSARTLPPAPRWTTPLLAYGEEEVAGTSLQPFANLRQSGRVYHTGQDVGACLDGAGYYAAADGIVKLVHSGSDMGTMIVVQHRVDQKRVLNAVYMHGGDTVFINAGDRVECGQLLGTMGMSFSLENGGHFAHLHYGLYPGSFSLTHNYGYKEVSAGLADWIDPALFLPQWIERTRPLLPHLRALDGRVGRAVDQAEQGGYAAAYAAAVRIRDAADPGSEVHVDATYLADQVANAVGNVLRRARKLQAAGYANDARRVLKDHASKFKGVPGGDRIRAMRDSWEQDPLFQKALKGEGRFKGAKRRAARARDRAGRRAVWRKMLEDFGDTCLVPRIKAMLR